MPTPSSPSIDACLRTNPTTCDRVAPSVIRTPISAVRSATRCDITPWMPAAANSSARPPKNAEIERRRKGYSICGSHREPVPLYSARNYAATGSWRYS